MLYAGGPVLSAALAGRARTPSTDPDSPTRCTALLPDLESVHYAPKAMPLRTMSSPMQAACTTRASTPTIERSTTVPPPASTKPMSFFCYTPRATPHERIAHAPTPLVTPFGTGHHEPRALSPSLQTAFGMATPLQRALQIALQSSGSMSAFEAASDMSHHTSVPLNVTPVHLSSFDALPYGGAGHPMEFGVDLLAGADSLSNDLQGLSFGNHMDGLQ